MDIYKPKVRGGFSDRNNLEVINRVIQKDDKYLIEYSSNKRIRITTYELV